MTALTPELLLHAYTIGVFPMAEHRDDPDVFWVDPKKRGILPLESFHISRSLARRIRRGDYVVTIDADFDGVLQGCAARDETWINDKIRQLYVALHRAGYAHSLEIWREGALVGGVYGVTIGAAFFGESMFSRETDASKLALAYLVTHLRATGFRLFDTQFITPHLASLGAVELPRARYHAILREVIEEEADFNARSVPTEDQVLQRKTQTS